MEPDLNRITLYDRFLTHLSFQGISFRKAPAGAAKIRQKPQGYRLHRGALQAPYAKNTLWKKFNIYTLRRCIFAGENIYTK